MNDQKEYFHNKWDMDTVPAGALWVLEGNYAKLLEREEKWLIHYHSHEHWFDKVEKEK